MWERRIKQLATEIALLSDEMASESPTPRAEVLHVYELREHRADNTAFDSLGLFSSLASAKAYAERCVRAKTEEGLRPANWWPDYPDREPEPLYSTSHFFLNTRFTAHRHALYP